MFSSVGLTQCVAVLLGSFEACVAEMGEMSRENSRGGGELADRTDNQASMRRRGLVCPVRRYVHVDG